MLKIFSLHYIDGLVQDCNNSTADALELLQFCTKLSIWSSETAVNGCCQASWWRHDMEILSSLLALCEENPLVTGGLPSQIAIITEL